MLEDALARRRGVDATVEDGEFRGWYHVRRKIAGRPSVTIVVPFRDQAAHSPRGASTPCRRHPATTTSSSSLVDNGSVEPETLALRDRLGRRAIRVLEHPGPFNWSAINNGRRRPATPTSCCS